LKPFNVLVGENEGKPRLRVIDFGLAKSLARSAIAGEEDTLAAELA